VKTVIVNDEIGSIGFIGAVIVGGGKPAFLQIFSKLALRNAKLLIMKRMASF
jgi:hypothetical protein